MAMVQSETLGFWFMPLHADLVPKLSSLARGSTVREPATVTVTHFHHHVLRLGHLASFPAGRWIDMQAIHRPPVRESIKYRISPSR